MAFALRCCQAYGIPPLTGTLYDLDLATLKVLPETSLALTLFARFDTEAGSTWVSKGARILNTGPVFLGDLVETRRSNSVMVHHDGP